MSLASVTEDVRKLKEIVEALEKFIDDGDDITLPHRQVSVLVEELKRQCDKHDRILEDQQNKMNKFSQESLKARNQIVYMFLAIFATLLGKFAVTYFTGQ